jgi:multicomponent Na+:H+ antiporter subunit C
MIWILAISAGALVAAGAYLALSRHVLRAVIGVSLIGSGANLVVLSAGRVDATLPAFVAEGARNLPDLAANPLPQALMLTAIVIGFALTCFALALVMCIQQEFGVTDSAALSAAEPTPGADGLPVPFNDGR